VVRRVFRRAGREWIKGERDRVYCDEVGEVAYHASCFRSYDENQRPAIPAAAGLGGSWEHRPDAYRSGPRRSQA
jgi:hypothetical protein